MHKVQCCGGLEYIVTRRALQEHRQTVQAWRVRNHISIGADTGRLTVLSIYWLHLVLVQNVNVNKKMPTYSGQVIC